MVVVVVEVEVVVVVVGMLVMTHGLVWERSGHININTINHNYHTFRTT